MSYTEDQLKSLSSASEREAAYSLMTPQPQRDQVPINFTRVIQPSSGLPSPEGIIGEGTRGKVPCGSALVGHSSPAAAITTTAGNDSAPPVVGAITHFRKRCEQTQDTSAYHFSIPTVDFQSGAIARANAGYVFTHGIDTVEQQRAC